MKPVFFSHVPECWLHPQPPPAGDIASQSQIVPRWRGLGVDKKTKFILLGYLHFRLIHFWLE